MDSMFEGLRLMLVGMGVVFCFLTILVCAMYFSAHFFSRFAHLFPDPEPPVGTRSHPDEDLTEAAVIVAAISAWRLATSIED